MDHLSFRPVLYAADVSVLRDECLYRLAYSTVSEERRKKTDRYRRDTDKFLSLGAEILLLYALRTAGFSGSPEFFSEKNGKPYLYGGPYFNLSHSGNISICAVSPFEIGCDIERITDADVNLAKRFFHPDEYGAVLSSEAGEERNSLFFRLWTMKESFLKATGLGLTVPLDSFSVDPDSYVTFYRGKEYFFTESGIVPGYKCSVCTAVKTDVDFLSADIAKILENW
ncbi:MAG: 4'-phosphopantetheinyl transferase superfamily protein [Clostridia bacterium]|nr:4'-phosphopantetheinyl transferase superfamily protein [Clostridia bacterium]